MKKRSLFTQVLSGLLLAFATLSLSSCAHKIYYEPTSNYSGRPIPPSGLLQRVLAAYTINGSQGGLEILDGLRDIRSNVQNTIPAFFISGFSAAQPSTIISFPEETRGYVLSQTDGSLISVDYGGEKVSGSVASFGSQPPSAAAATDGSLFAGAAEGSGALVVTGSSGTFALDLPNVDKVVINRGNTVVLAMVRNSNLLYRVVKLVATPNPVVPPGAVDCEPRQVPVFCVVPVGNTSSTGVVGGAYDRPVDAYFSLDGNSVYILNCGPECGGIKAGVTVLQVGQLVETNIPTIDPLNAAAPSPLLTLPVANPIAVPGGVTAAVSDGSTLYLSGQELLSSGSFAGLFTGQLSTIDLSSYNVTGQYSISDGHHSKMLLADDNTLWIGSQQCAVGERAALAAQQLAAGQTTTQAANYNCLTRVGLPATSGAAPAIQIVPAVTQGGAAPVTVPYPNTNLNQFYYGDLTGICWVQNYHKVYTAYGGQIHAFNTADGSEINNNLITVQGTVLDVAYMDALTNSAN